MGGKRPGDPGDTALPRGQAARRLKLVLRVREIESGVPDILLPVTPGTQFLSPTFSVAYLDSPGRFAPPSCY